MMAALLLTFRLNMRSFWTDEWYGLRFFDMSFWEYLQYYWSYPDNHPPGFYALTTALVQWLGKVDAVVRLPAILGALWAFVASGLLVRHVVKERAKAIMLISLFFIATAPYVILMGQTARYFTLSAGAGLTVLYALLRLIDKPVIGRGVWYGLSVVAAGYLDYPTLLYSVMGSAAVLALDYYRRRSFPAIKVWFFSSAAAALVLLPLVPILIAEIKAEALSGPDVLSGGLLALAVRVLGYGYAVSHGMISLPFGLVSILWIAFFGLLAGLLWKRPRQKIKAIFSDAHYILVFAVSALVFNTIVFGVLDRYSPIAFPRYVLLYVYIFFILLAALIVRSSKSFFSRFILVAVVSVIHISGLISYYDQSSYVDATFFADSKGMFEFVSDNALPGDALLISDDLPIEIYRWYQDQYFEELVTYDGWTDPPSDRIWVVSVAHDKPSASSGAQDRALQLVDRLGQDQWQITRRHFGSPLHDDVVAIKDGLVGNETYWHKVGAFLLERDIDAQPTL